MKLKLAGIAAVFTLLTFSPFAFSATETNAQIKKDGEVIAWVSAIDTFEVNAAEISAKKNVDDTVKEYSSMLYNDHSKNLKETTALSEQINEKPVETKALNKFKKDGKKQLAKLDKQEANFQKDFINAMVVGHQDAINKVDNDLMKKVDNASLKTLLQATRDMIIHHLEVAKEIQKKMQA